MSSWDGRRIFQKHPFYNTYIEKPKFKALKNVDLLNFFQFTYLFRKHNISLQI